MSILGLSNSEDNNYYIRWMPSVNSWKTGDEEVELKYILVDPESVKTGWGRIQMGIAPDWKWDEQLGQRTSRPADGLSEEERMEYKRGFKVDLFNKDIGLRTWSATGTGATMGFEKLYTDIHAGLKDNPGKVPVVEYTGSEAIKVGTKGGSTRVPEFRIVKWTETKEFDWEQSEPYEEPEDLNGSTSDDTPFDDEIPF